MRIDASIAIFNGTLCVLVYTSVPLPHEGLRLNRIPTRNAKGKMYQGVIFAKTVSGLGCCDRFRDTAERYYNYVLEGHPLQESIVNIRRYLAVLSTLCLLTAGANAVAQSKPTSGSTKHRVVIQVSDSDPKKWQLALNNAQNVQEDLGKNQVEVEIVAYGPGLGMLKLDSAVAGGVVEALGNGVEVVACENTMTRQKIPKEDIISKVGFVKAGVVELMNKQEMGYSYIRP